MKRLNKIPVVIIEHTNGMVFIQCLDMNIGAQGDSRENAERNLIAVLGEETRIARENRVDLIDAVGPAPKKYQHMRPDGDFVEFDLAS